MLSKEDILSAKDLKTKDVEVPEWGGAVRVRTMTGADRMKFQHLVSAKGKKESGVIEALLIAAVVDDNGEPLFSADDLAALQSKSTKAIQRVFEAAAELNGLTDKSIDDLSGE